MFPQQVPQQQQQQQRPQGGDLPQRSSRMVISPHNNDVLLGRGGNNNKHVGNAQLRSLARSRVAKYSRASKKDKSKISREMVSIVRELNPPGRFLKRHQFSEEWEDVGDDVAREKASQALRDAVSQKDSGDDIQDKEILEKSAIDEGNIAGGGDLLHSHQQHQMNAPAAIGGRMQSPFGANLNNASDRMHTAMHDMNSAQSSLPVSMMAQMSMNPVLRIQQLQMQEMQQLQMQRSLNAHPMNLQGFSAMNQQRAAMNCRYPTTTLDENSINLPLVASSGNNNSNNMDAAMTMDTSEASASVTSASSSTSNQQKYKYYGGFRPKVPQLKHQTNLDNKNRIVPVTSMPVSGNSPSTFDPALTTSSDAPERFPIEDNSAMVQNGASFLPSLYQHIEDRMRYRNEHGSKRVRQHVHNVHFNDRSSIRSSIAGRSSIGQKSSMGGIETISNYSSRMASESDLDLTNFNWTGNLENTSVMTDMNMSCTSYDSV